MFIAAWFWLGGCIGCPNAGESSVLTEQSPRAAVVAPATFEIVQPSARDAKWSDAVCNDGSPFALEVRDQGSDVWVISFSGGYFCDDEAVPCAARARRLTTTLPAKDGQRRAEAREGVFSRNPLKNPTFHDANHVDLHYCSSDLWLGERTGRQATGASERGWHFAGRRNARAGLEYLKTAGLDPTDRILVIGYSAGGLGAVGNIDTLLDVYGEQHGRGALKIVLDGSWIPTWSTDAMPKANRWGPTHTACEQEKTSEGLDPLGCVFGPEWWPYVASTGVPILVQISGQDTTQMPAFGVDEAPDKQRWREAVRASLDGVPWVFSGGQPYHVLSHNRRFDKSAAEHGSFQQLLAEFWAGEPARQVFFNYAE